MVKFEKILLKANIDGPTFIVGGSSVLVQIIILR
jgi:hypothetical protein